MSKKPSLRTIREAPLLSLQKRAVVAANKHPTTVCTLCGETSADLSLWREHDDRDKPIPGPLPLIFIGNDHPVCMKIMKDHPRLYAEETGSPGHFPRLCGNCYFRNGWKCAHQDLKENGGNGLLVGLKGFGVGAILCSRSGCHTPLARAVSCAGHRPLTTPITNEPQLAP